MAWFQTGTSHWEAEVGNQRQRREEGGPGVFPVQPCLVCSDCVPRSSTISPARGLPNPGSLICPQEAATDESASFGQNNNTNDDATC